MRHRTTFFAFAFCAGLGLWVAGAQGADAGASDAGKPKAPKQESTPVAGSLSADPDARSFVKGEVKPLPKLSEDGGVGKRVAIVPIKGTIDLGLAPFIERALSEASDASVVIFDVDTFGGRVDAAVKIRDRLLSAKVTTVAFVNRRAISAGALISLAADYIVFTPGGSMGAATPVQMSGGQAKPVAEKMVSYMRSEMRATAEAKGRNGDLAEAMVDADVEISGVSKKGKLLTLTTDKAKETGLSNANADDLKDLLSKLGLEKAEQVKPETNWAEQVARFLTDPVVSGLLMSLGMLGLLLELYQPGFGITGIIGLVCLMLFFGGHMVVDLAGWEEVALFGAGIIALGIEVFVLPGFGVAGVIGITLIALALMMALMGLPLGVSWDLGLVNSALTTVMLSLLGTVVGMLLLMRYLPSASFGKWLVLQTTLGSAEAAVIDEEYTAPPVDWARFLGSTGHATTDLRPAGKARLEGEVVDVVSEGPYIERGDPVRVVQVEGVRVVVALDTKEG